jgi:EmrB/QacA subfamily drug resistance transporter
MAPGLRRRVATVAVVLGLVVSAFEGTVVTSAMPTITTDLGGRALYSWVFSAFLMATTLGVLLVGKLADQYGRRPVFTGGMILFLTGSILCGQAHTMSALILFRIIQGFGAGALQPVTTTITGDIYTLRERATIQAVLTSAWGAANVLGPVIGGWIVMHASWRWVFLVNVPIGALAALLLLASYRDPLRRTSTQLDFMGPLLAGAPIALTLLALEPGALSMSIRVILAGAALVGVWCFLQHQRATGTPLLPPHLLQDRTVTSGLVGGAFVGALLYTASAYLPLYVTETGHRTPVIAGFALVPVLIGWAIASPLGVRILLRGGMRASLGGGMMLALAGSSLLAATMVWEAPLWCTGVAAFVLGLGLGPAGATSTIGPQARVQWNERAVVTSTIFATRMLGGSLGVALLALARGRFAEQFTLMVLLAALGAWTMTQLAPGPERSLPFREGEPVLETAA